MSPKHHRTVRWALLASLLAISNNPIYGYIFNEYGTALIETPEDLVFLSKYTNYEVSAASGGEWNGTLILSNDIDMAGYEIKPIGNRVARNLLGKYYNLDFYGCNHTISNLTVTSTGDAAAGLFGSFQYASLHSVVIHNATIRQENGGPAGILAGKLLDSTVEGCASTGSLNIVTTSEQKGGMVGEAAGTRFTACYTAYDQFAYEPLSMDCCFKAGDVDFANGELCAKLNGAKTTGCQAWYVRPYLIGDGSAWHVEMGTVDGSQVWYQKIGKDPYPVYTKTNDNTVYAGFKDGHTLCYTNDSTHLTASRVHTVTFNEGGFGNCTVCGDLVYQPVELDSDNYYVISNEGQLYSFVDKVNIFGEQSANARLTVDLHMGWQNMFPIGLYSDEEGAVQCPYKGTFDGMGHTINDLTIAAEDQYEAGFFGRATGATIQNVIIQHADIRQPNNVRAGVLAGELHSCNVSNCATELIIFRSQGQNGGIAGEAYESTLKGCFTTDSVLTVNAKNVENCFADGQAGYDNGELCYKLNGNITDGSQAWFQNIGEDYYPILTRNDSNTVYYCYESTACNAGMTYSNRNITERDAHATTAFDDEGYGSCDKCGAEVAQEASMSPDDSHYQIGNAGQLFWFAQKVGKEDKEACAKLTHDIALNDGTFDAEGRFVAADGSAEKPLRSWPQIKGYKGTFDGCGYTISGLYFNDPAVNEMGLFATCSGATLQNIRLDNSYISAQSSVGALCGEAKKTTLQNVSVTNSFVRGASFVGGLCGNNMTSCSISNCYVAADVSGNKYVGGLCGLSFSPISNCYTRGNIGGAEIAGGLCGSNVSAVTNCYSDCSVPNQKNCGILCGYNVGATIGCQGPVDFGTGEICYLLNGSTNNGEDLVWGQNLGTDATPQLNGLGVYHEREMKGVWGTICLPFTVYSDGDVQFYTLAKVDETTKTMKFLETDMVPANTPAVCRVCQEGNLFVHASDGGVSALDDKQTDCGTGWSLVGTYQTITLPKDGTHYYAGWNLEWNVDVILQDTQETADSLTVPAFHAYFCHPYDETIAKEYAFGFYDAGGDDGDGIENIAPACTASEEAVYNLAGQRVGSHYKGICIQGGKKIVR